MTRHTERVSRSRSRALAFLCILGGALVSGAGAEGGRLTERYSVDEVMLEVLRKYKRNDGKYERLAKKVDAGADFVQTQAVYDVPRFAAAVKRAEDAGLTERTAILAGIIVPRSAGMLRYMNANVPGIDVPDELIKRLKSAPDPKQEGVRIALELIDGVRNIH